MKNKLTLKALKEDLENLKASKSSISKSKPVTETHKSSVAHDIKNSYIQNLHMKSSMFYLWLITAVLSYAHKIPYIGRIITLLSMYYGKTTIWKVLIKLRRLFILFNAVIGIFMVYKTTGFSTDNILAGFAGMGHTYLELFMNFNKRLFNWIVEFFDHKIVPNIPGDTPTPPKTYPWSNGKLWGFNPPSNTTNILPDFSLRELYAKNPPININLTPWYKDISSWLWIVGITVTVGSLFVGYKLITDPLYIETITSSSYFPSTESLKNKSNKLLEISKTLVTAVKNNLKKLNPAYWFLDTTDYESQYNDFVDLQTSTDYNKHLYPYSPVNPFASWYEKLRISWLGETESERVTRRLLKNEYLGIIFQPTNIETNVASTSAMTHSPNIGNVGLGIGNTPGSPFLHTVEVANKLFSAPPTPTELTPRIDTTNLPNVNNPFNDVVADAVIRLNSPDI